MTELHVFCIGALGVVFGVSLLSKVLRFRWYVEFRSSLVALPVHPRLRGGSVAAAVVIAEGLTSLLVVFYPLLGAIASMLMLSAFIYVIAVTKFRKPGEVHCRCFGAGSEPLGTPQLVRNALLMALAVLLLASELLPHTGVAHLHVMLLGAFAGFLVTRWDDLWSLFAQPQQSRLSTGAANK